MPAPFSVIQIRHTFRLYLIIVLYHCNPQRQAAVDASLMLFENIYIVCTLCIFDSFPSPFTNMKRSNRGRPPRKESRPVVWLTTSTLKLWNELKRHLGFTNKSNSVFAEALLNCIVPGEENEAASRSESSSHKNQQTRVEQGNVEPCVERML